ncbi:hypothetical protein G3A39_38415 [Paraburkholderia aspalathi]|nr:hypothetical protein [Paraburkholderia aspalathi]
MLNQVKIHSKLKPYDNFYFGLEASENDTFDVILSNLHDAVLEIKGHIKYLKSLPDNLDSCENDYMESDSLQDHTSELHDMLTHRFTRYLRAMAVLGRPGTGAMTAHVAGLAAALDEAYEAMKNGRTIQ